MILLIILYYNILQYYYYFFNITKYPYAFSTKKKCNIKI